MTATLAFRRAHLAGIARELASRQLDGNAYRAGPGMEPSQARFRSDLRAGFDWGAAFVYHCVRTAGLDLPFGRIHEGACVSVTVRAWIAWATRPDTACYFPAGGGFVPDSGDLIVFDDLPGHDAQDHIGVIVDQTDHAYITAEGNVKNRTGIFVHRKGHHVSGFILLPEGDEAPGTVLAARMQRLQTAADAHRSCWSKGARTAGPPARAKVG